MGRLAPAVGRLFIQTDRGPDDLGPPDHVFHYCGWCQVFTHDARYSASRQPHVKYKIEDASLIGEQVCVYLTRMDKTWLKQRLRASGKTSADLAAAIARDRAVVSRIMNGHQAMTLDQAKIIATEIGTPLSELLARAGLADPPTAQVFTPGFAESDATQWIAGPSAGEVAAVRGVASALGADRPGIDIWRVKGQAMALAGLLAGDFLLIDTHASERARAGDVVVAQIYNNATGSALTVLRRFEPPVLVAASIDPSDGRVHVVDGVNVVIRGKVIASWRV
jgi:SOS-response transcriptional repressor LexA